MLGHRLGMGRAQAVLEQRRCPGESRPLSLPKRALTAAPALSGPARQALHATQCRSAPVKYSTPWRPRTDTRRPAAFCQTWHAIQSTWSRIRQCCPRPETSCLACATPGWARGRSSVLTTGRLPLTARPSTQHRDCLTTAAAVLQFLWPAAFSLRTSS